MTGLEVGFCEESTLDGLKDGYSDEGNLEVDGPFVGKFDLIVKGKIVGATVIGFDVETGMEEEGFRDGYNDKGILVGRFVGERVGFLDMALTLALPSVKLKIVYKSFFGGNIPKAKLKRNEVVYRNKASLLIVTLPPITDTFIYNLKVNSFNLLFVAILNSKTNFLN